MLISVSELLKRAAILYRDNFATLLKYLLLTLIPAAVLTGIISAVFLIPVFLSTPWSDLRLWQIAAIVIVVGVIVIIASIASMWLNFNLMRVIGKLYRRETVDSVAITTKQSTKVLWKGIGTSIVSGLYVIGPFLAACVLFYLHQYAIPEIGNNPIFHALNIVVGILLGLLALYGVVHLVIFSIKLTFAVYETVIAEKPVRGSLDFSLTMTKNRWGAILWRLLGTIIAVMAVYLIAAFILNIPFSLLLEKSVAHTIAGFLSQLISFFITPFAMAAGIILYEEVKKLGPAQKV
ncbi:MAG: hypothetical protein HY980_02690 [Candidatus Magasanikbacteria bacterium]|nr:hypothetical protein [Candidatus Magasanikbacteria bacterium]